MYFPLHNDTSLQNMLSCKDSIKQNHTQPNTDVCTLIKGENNEVHTSYTDERFPFYTTDAAKNYMIMYWLGIIFWHK